MLTARTQHKVCCGRTAATLSRAFIFSYVQPDLRMASMAYRHSPRLFSTTSTTSLRDFFPTKETQHIRTTPPTWPHHGYSEEEISGVVPAHRPPRTIGDRFAWRVIRFARWAMDKATGLEPEQQVDKKNPTTAIVALKPLTEAQWVCRNKLAPEKMEEDKEDVSIEMEILELSIDRKSNNSLFASCSWKALPASPVWSAGCSGI